MGKQTMWFPNRPDTNRPVQSQKQARSLKFRIYEEEEVCYPLNENKGADQLRGFCFCLVQLMLYMSQSTAMVMSDFLLVYISFLTLENTVRDSHKRLKVLALCCLTSQQYISHVGTETPYLGNYN